MSSKSKGESKSCIRCGRPFTNRKKWANRGQWEQVKYCSKRCRNQRSQNSI